jgi:hypothetical protein
MPTAYTWVPSPEHEYPERLTELEARLPDFKAERLEAGYRPVNVSNGTATVFAALTGEEFVNPGDKFPHKEPNIERMIESIRAWHGFM